MNDYAQQIARLQAEIEEQQVILSDLEAEVADLRRDVEAFQKRYERIVRPVEVRLEAARAAIAELERQQYLRRAHPLGGGRPLEDTWQPPEGYVPVEEQYRRTWQVPPPPPEEPVPVRPAATDPEGMSIKQLYRQLARRYHPDLATEPAERAFRNDLMARINAAYTARDLGALQALARQPEGAHPEQPLAALRLQELEQIARQLKRRIADLKLEKAGLLYGDMLRLSLEEKLVRRQGRNLLAEMAARLEREYDEAMARLEQLRRSQRSSDG